ncbi:MAG: hypothetical protein ACI9BD_000593 [Candidatus Marinamargulisbacteria bacterium]|jgi:hypothetical protein
MSGDIARLRPLNTGRAVGRASETSHPQTMTDLLSQKPSINPDDAKSVLMKVRPEDLSNAIATLDSNAPSVIDRVLKKFGEEGHPQAVVSDKAFPAEILQICIEEARAAVASPKDSARILTGTC